MSRAIVCHGCGARLTIPDDYPRNKMQCPECGVMCPVPPQPAGEKKARERPPAEDAALFDDEPAAPIRRPAAPPPPATVAEEPTPAGKGLANCPCCGELVRVPRRKKGRGGKCPACGTDWPEPAKKKPAAPSLPIPPPPDEFAGSAPDADPESGNPYRTADGARRCPGCSDLLGPEVVVCVRCGFDLRTGHKTVKEYGKFERSWDSGMPPATRWVLFLLCQAVAVIAIVATFLRVDDSPSVAVPTFFFSWLIYTGMTAFLLGSYDHVYLKRYKSGRVDLIKTLRIAFIPFKPKEIDVRAYHGVVGGRMANVEWWDWLICASLVVSGVFPAVIWWYCTIYKIVYTVSLTDQYGRPDVMVYRGWGEGTMTEIQQALRDAMTV